MSAELRRGTVCWVELDPARGREQAGRRPALVVSSDIFLAQADSLAIILPATATDRGWPNHVRLRGNEFTPQRPTFAMTEQPRTIARERIHAIIGVVDSDTMREVDQWLRDFLSLP